MLGTILATTVAASIGAAAWDICKLDKDLGPEMEASIRFNKNLVPENVALFTSEEISQKKKCYSKIYTQIVTDEIHYCKTDLAEMIIMDPRISIKYETEIREKVKYFSDPNKRILMVDALNCYLENQDIVARSAELMFDFIKSNNIKYVAIEKGGIKSTRKSTYSSFELVRKLINLSEKSGEEVFFVLIETV